MKPLWNRIFYGACIGVIILCWAGIWIRFERSNTAERSIDSLDQVWQCKHKPKVLILFSLSDCGLCLQEAEFWSKAEFLYGNDCEILGLTTNSSRELSEFISEYQLTFKIQRDDKLYHQVMKGLSIDESPAKVYISSDGNILSIEGSMKDRADQEKFPQRVASALFHGDKRQESQLSSN